MKEKSLKILLYIAALFFLFEAIIHFFAFPILEHDKIFLPTHDRYIAIFALTYAVLFFLSTTDLKRYKTLLQILLCGLFLSLLNAFWIAQTGGYAQAFGTEQLDASLSIIGIITIVWFIFILFLLCKQNLLPCGGKNKEKL